MPITGVTGRYVFECCVEGKVSSRRTPPTTPPLLRLEPVGENDGWLPVAVRRDTPLRPGPVTSAPVVEYAASAAGTLVSNEANVGGCTPPATSEIAAPTSTSAAIWSDIIGVMLMT